ncbi:hypothetical protein [Nocardia mexicana]|uniref:hypothetical protein n=1 Tax=Nocardia mexicana TaxID=279262 RepID=UPI0011C03B31|nr:hypothetical protein [Nocardia mexicana]
MLETVPQIVAEALAAGAAAGLTDTAQQTVVDAYQRLKSLASERYRQISVEPVEQLPTSEARRAVLAEDLERAGARDDRELLTAAQAVIAVVRDHEAAAAAVVGVDLERVHAAALRIGSVDSTGTGVKIFEGVFDETIEIGQVRAGGVDHHQDPPVARR